MSLLPVWNRLRAYEVRPGLLFNLAALEFTVALFSPPEVSPLTALVAWLCMLFVAATSWS